MCILMGKQVYIRIILVNCETPSAMALQATVSRLADRTFPQNEKDLLFHANIKLM